MEPPEPEVPINAQKTEEPLDQVKHPPTPEEPVEQETEVPEPLQVPIVTPQTKTNSSRTTITSGSTYAKTYAIA